MPNTDIHHLRATLRDVDAASVNQTRAIAGLRRALAEAAPDPILLETASTVLAVHARETVDLAQSLAAAARDLLRPA